MAASYQFRSARFLRKSCNALAPCVIAFAPTIARADAAYNVALGSAAYHRSATNSRPTDPTTFGASGALSVGARLPTTVIGLRLLAFYTRGRGVLASGGSTDITRAALLLGASVQWFPHARLWLGAGAGPTANAYGDSEVGQVRFSAGLEARIGTRSTIAGRNLDVFAQAMLALGVERRDSIIAVMVGYQYVEDSVVKVVH